MDRHTPITPEMVADWVGPDGYTDINPHNHYCFAYKGGWAFIIFGDDGEVAYFATMAHGGPNTLSGGNKRHFCPTFCDIPPDIATRFQRHRPMVEPEFTLDEMAQAEELVGHQKG